MYLWAGVAAHSISPISSARPAVLQLISKCLKVLNACIWQGQLARLLQCWIEVTRRKLHQHAVYTDLMVIPRPGQHTE